jgi:hypothetical protein
LLTCSLSGWKAGYIALGRRNLHCFDDVDGTPAGFSFLRIRIQGLRRAAATPWLSDTTALRLNRIVNRETLIWTSMAILILDIDIDIEHRQRTPVAIPQRGYVRQPGVVDHVNYPRSLGTDCPEL